MDSVVRYLRAFFSIYSSVIIVAMMLSLYILVAIVTLSACEHLHLLYDTVKFTWLRKFVATNEKKKLERLFRKIFVIGHF